MTHGGWRLAMGPLALALVLPASAGCERPEIGPGHTGAASVQAPASPPAPSAPVSSLTEHEAEEAEEGEPDSIAAQHILIAYRGAERAPKGMTRSKAGARKLSEEVAKKARQAPGDAEFAALAREYSDDLGTKDNLGNLGKFPKDKMVKPFADAAFRLKVGEISEPVETPFGFHIIKRNQ